MRRDISILETSVRERKNLLGKLGDAGRFLADLFRGKEISPAGVKKQVTELEQYLATCFDQIDEIGREWEKTDRHLVELNRKRKEASRATRGTLLAQAELLLRKCDGYQGSIGKLKTNGMVAQVLVEKLRDLLILISGPLSEDAIDQWTAELEGAIEERAMTEKALEELERTSERSMPAQARPAPAKEVEAKLDRISAQETQSGQEREVEKRLEELFEE